MHKKINATTEKIYNAFAEVLLEKAGITMNDIDITYNASLLMELQKIIISIYFNKHK